MAPDRPPAYLPSLRRWTRVFLSSLRCFFFAMRLRRFLMTEPTGQPLDIQRAVGEVGRHDRDSLAVDERGAESGGAGWDERAGQRTTLSARAVEALAEVLVHVVLGDPEGAAHA